MPSPPVIGETMTPMMAAPAAESGRCVVERATPHLGIADHAPGLVGLGLPRLELRLHQNHQIGVVSSEGDEVRGDNA